MSSKQARKLLALREAQAAKEEEERKAQAAKEAEAKKTKQVKESKDEGEKSSDEDEDNENVPTTMMLPQQQRTGGFFAFQESSDEDDDEEESDSGSSSDAVEGSDGVNDGSGRKPETADNAENKNPEDFLEDRENNAKKFKQKKEEVVEEDSAGESSDDDWRAIEEAHREHHGEDINLEVDRLNAKLQSKSASSSSVPPRYVTMEDMLRCYKGNFSMDAEHRRIFGESMSGGNASSGNNSLQTRSGRRVNLAQIPAHLRKSWLSNVDINDVGPVKPDPASCGSCVMSMVAPPALTAAAASAANSGGDTAAFASVAPVASVNTWDVHVLRHSRHAQSISEDFSDVMMSFDPHMLQQFLQAHPFHVDGLLFQVETLRTQGNYDYALTLLKRALFVLELNFPVGFRPVGGGAPPGPADDTKEHHIPPQKLSPNGLSILGKALFLYMVSCGGQGLFATALESAKLIWKLSYSEASDVGFDPCHMQIHCLYYAIRAKKYDWIHQAERNCKWFSASEDAIGLLNTTEFPGLYADERNDDDDMERQGDAPKKITPSLGAIYPPMVYTIALAKWQTMPLRFAGDGGNRNYNYMKDELSHLAVSDVCCWVKSSPSSSSSTKKSATSASLSFAQAYFRFPYVFRRLLERAEINLDAPAPKEAKSTVKELTGGFGGAGGRTANMLPTWNSLLRMLDEELSLVGRTYSHNDEEVDISALESSHRVLGLSTLANAYAEEFHPLWRNGPILGWCYDVLIRLLAMFRGSDLFKNDWRKARAEMVLWILEQKTTKDGDSPISKVSRQQEFYKCYHDLGVSEHAARNDQRVLPRVLSRDAH